MSTNFMNSLFDFCINQLSTPENKQKIMTGVIDPLLNDINNKYYYQYSCIIFLLVAIVILLIILISRSGSSVPLIK